MSADAEVASRLQHLIAQGQSQDVVQYAEEFELALGHASVNAQTSCVVYTAQLLGYLISRDLNNARFLWKRIPADTRGADAELGKAWQVGKHMWKGERGEALRALGAASGWSALAAPLVGMLHAALTEHTLRLIADSYTSIQLADAAQMLATTADSVASLAQQRGWDVQPAPGGGAAVLLPRPAPRAACAHDLRLSQLTQLTKLVAQLE